MVSLEMRGTELIARIRGKGNVCKLLTGKLERESPLERDRRSWYVNIKTYFREIVSEGVNRIQLAQDRYK
jgi:hypothetical protein